jgi:uncharacterized protein (DUF983 family)
MAQKKKICPKCGTMYEGKVHQFTTMCPLRHCPKCGYKYTEMSEDDVDRVMGIFVIGLFLVPLGIAGIIGLTALIVPPTISCMDSNCGRSSNSGFLDMASISETLYKL